jgi:hypothetical protein
VDVTGTSEPDRLGEQRMRPKPARSLVRRKSACLRDHR